MRLFNGPNLAAFEKEFASYCGVRHAVGVASGTDAIFLSLQALRIGAAISHSTGACAGASHRAHYYVGAIPILVDKAVGDYGPDLRD
jgi:dTDP-4-amino-4,6-dideoxygalactose transaminase